MRWKDHDPNANWESFLEFRYWPLCFPGEIAHNCSHHFVLTGFWLYPFLLTCTHSYCGSCSKDELVVRPTVLGLPTQTSSALWLNGWGHRQAAQARLYPLCCEPLANYFNLSLFHFSMISSSVKVGGDENDLRGLWKRLNELKYDRHLHSTLHIAKCSINVSY